MNKDMFEYAKNIEKIKKQNNRNVLIAGNSNEEYVERLEKLGFNVFKTLKTDFLYESISYHPDIVIHPVDSKNILVEKGMLEYYENLFKNLDLNLIPTNDKFTGKYPGYTGLNIGRVGSYFIHNPEYTDHEALLQFSKLGLKLIRVKQGYSKCSTLTLSDTAVITTDKGIERAILSEEMSESVIDKKIDVLYINPEGIRLDGMNYGFIGGCGGMVSEKDLVLTGRFDHLEDAERIYRFLDNNRINVIYLSDNGINDIGGIIKLGE